MFIRQHTNKKKDWSLSFFSTSIYAGEYYKYLQTYAFMTGPC